MKRCFAVLFLLSCSGFQITPPPTISVTKEAAGKIQIEVISSTGETIQDDKEALAVFNPRSGLIREKIAVHDKSMPVDFMGNPTVRAVYKKSDSGKFSDGQYLYRASAMVTSNQDVSATEIRFVLFDIWGNHTATLSKLLVEDVKKGESSAFDAEWETWSSLYPVTECLKYSTSVAFIARAKAKDNRVIEANLGNIMQEVRKLYRGLSPDSLQPTPEPANRNIRSSRTAVSLD